MVAVLSRAQEKKEGCGGPRKKGVRSLAHEKRKAGIHEDLKAVQTVEVKIREDGSILSGEKSVAEII